MVKILENIDYICLKCGKEYKRKDRYIRHIENNSECTLYMLFEKKNDIFCCKGK